MKRIFFVVYHELRKHWLLQRSGLNTTETSKKMSAWMIWWTHQCHMLSETVDTEICSNADSANMLLFPMAAAHAATIWLKQKRKVIQFFNFKLWVSGYCIPGGMILSVVGTLGQSPHVRWEENPRGKWNVTHFSNLSLVPENYNKILGFFSPLKKAQFCFKLIEMAVPK